MRPNTVAGTPLCIPLTENVQITIGIDEATLARAVKALKEWNESEDVNLSSGALAVLWATFPGPYEESDSLYPGGPE